ncbi:MAG: protein sorting system archaetidylserine synthase [Halodesulfurarchaeum sp.]
MRPRFVGRLGLADWFTTLNAALGFVAVVVATVDVQLGARIVLLAAIADGLDGILARIYGGTEVGPYLDSLADVASFCVAPAVIVVAAVHKAGLFSASLYCYVPVAIGAAFVSMGVLRLAMYTAYDTDDSYTRGVPSTLAATILAVAALAGLGAEVLFVAMVAFTVLMVTRIPYPDLRIRDALVMGLVQALAVALPELWSALFPRVLLVWAIGYLVLGPWFYRRAEGKRS